MLSLGGTRAHCTCFRNLRSSVLQNMSYGKQGRSGCSLVLRHGSLKIIEVAARAGSVWALGSPGHTAGLDWEYPTARSPKLADGLSSPISPTKELLFLHTVLVQLLYLIIFFLQTIPPKCAN